MSVLALSQGTAGVHRQLENIPGEPSVKPASWIPTGVLRGLAARFGVAELFFGAAALDAINGVLEDGGA